MLAQTGSKNYSTLHTYDHHLMGVTYESIIIFKKVMEIDLEKEKPTQQPQQFKQIDEIRLEMNCKKQFRRQKISNIQNQIQNQIRSKERKPQNVVLYLLNLVILIAMSCLQASTLLELDVNLQIKAYLLISIVFVGFTMSLISNLLVAPWHQILKLYCLIDSIVPVIIASIIGFFVILNFTSVGELRQRFFAIAFPVWVFYLGGSLRVMLAYIHWSRWEIILYKIVLLFSGLVFFYVGFNYMNGAYKITSGYLISVESRFRDMVYLYVFGIVQLFFEYFRRLSDFDQTAELKFEYKFEDGFNKDKEEMFKAEVKKMQFEMLRQQIMEQKQSSARKLSANMLASSKSSIS